MPRTGPMYIFLWPIFSLQLFSVNTDCTRSRTRYRGGKHKNSECTLRADPPFIGVAVSMYNSLRASEYNLYSLVSLCQHRNPAHSCLLQNAAHHALPTGQNFCYRFAQWAECYPLGRVRYPCLLYYYLSVTKLASMGQNREVAHWWGQFVVFT